MDEIIRQAQQALNRLKYADAMALYQEIVSKDPNNAIGYQGLAYCLYNLERYDEALESSKKALEFDSTLALPHTIFAYIFDGQGQKEKAIQEAKIALNADPELPDVLCCYGILMLINENFDEAEKYLSAAIQIQPNLYLALHNLSVIYLLKRNDKAAFGIFLKLFQVKSNIRNFVRLAVGFLRVSGWLFGLLMIGFPFFAVLFHLGFLLLVPVLTLIISVLNTLFWIEEKKYRIDALRKLFLVSVPTMLASLYLISGMK